MTPRFGLFLAMTLAAALFAVQPDHEFQGMVVKKPFGPLVKGQAKASSTQILYHNGPVMNQSNSVYVIYYGSGFASTTQPIINNFLTDLSGSHEYSVNSTYNAGPDTPPVPLTYTFIAPASGPGSHASGSVFWDNYSQGAQLGTSTIPRIVANAIDNGLPSDANGVYLVVTSPDVKISGFCGSFCAYHSDGTATLSGGTSTHIRYALIPDPTQRCSSCNGGIAVYNDSATPNGDMGADTMTDDIMHELSETVTDPDISAWYTQTGAENADLCNYVYGSVNVGVAPNGATYHYNAELQTRSGRPHRYLIQQIWKDQGTGFCSSN